MKDMYKNEGYHSIPVEIENEVNVNSPELQNKCADRQPWVVMGFQDEEDYNRHMRRSSSRYKGSMSKDSESYKKTMESDGMTKGMDYSEY